MDSIGINIGFLIVQTINILLLLGWIGLAIYAFVRMRRQSLTEELRLLWSVVIIVFPIVGALAFLMRKP
ncbi:MAG: PLDc N-terminal domain-containing protein, partial [Anaerolineales bacterium]